MPNKQKSITSPKRYTMKQISLWIILLLVQLSVFAQKDETIVKIDKVEYSSIEFDYHYRKNAKILDQRESPQMYLERFIDYKLKLAEALRLKLDTVNNFLTEFQNYKLSLSNKHNAQGIIRDSLVHIAYKRLNEARNVSIITILAPEGSDTVRAFKRADSLYQALRKGASFADLATTKSEETQKRQYWLYHRQYAANSTRECIVHSQKRRIFSPNTYAKGLPYISCKRHHH
jgi:peptidyl-prolyl cis-trans isomerase SurA